MFDFNHMGDRVGMAEPQIEWQRKQGLNTILPLAATVTLHVYFAKLLAEIFKYCVSRHNKKKLAA